MRHRLDAEAYSAQLGVSKFLTPSMADPESLISRFNSSTSFSHKVLLTDDPRLARAANTSYMPVVWLVDPADKSAVQSKHSPKSYKTVHRVSRRCGWRTLEAALNRCADSTTSADGSEAADSLDPLNGLTRREREVLALVGQGMSVRECAEALSIAESTIDNHKYRLMKKLGVKKSLELIRIALRNGVIEL
ncbi:Oxygen regulatory protein NreC [Pseudobythopirellula maris]|uniref:Oxygen regulatory protein NreC n=1 Tax=Pseudobythopirellula maris TaxID=2527991 RepID=A0A5C5ZV62_9BACT|nr:LuxR C-terminal-related transcriptional regulator [Pseudobythopirellula maris]TWT90103.1 Oxygen regulatory protein NreC [Pseudobythopirellula maris]